MPQYVVTIPFIVDARSPSQANGLAGRLAQDAVREKKYILAFERIQAPMPVPPELEVRPEHAV